MTFAKEFLYIKKIKTYEDIKLKLWYKKFKIETDLQKLKKTFKILKILFFFFHFLLL